MSFTTLKTVFKKRETHFHIAFWLLYFSTINAYWTDNWFDRELRPTWVSQFAIIFFPIFLYLNAFWLIPTFLRVRKWFQYLFLTGIIIFAFEFLRCLLHLIWMPSEEPFITAFVTEFNSFDNLIFGRLSPAILALQFSFAYRLSADWFRHHWNQKTASHESNQDEGSSVASFKTYYSIKKRGGIELIQLTDIVYFKAQGDFVLAVGKDNRKHVINSTLSKIESEVDPLKFFKINRGEILNKSYVENYESYIKNRLKIVLSAYDAELYTSNSRTPQFRKWLQQ